MILFLIISSLLSAAVAQQSSISCNYVLIDAESRLYACDLSIFNPIGDDDFTGIGGIHLEGFTNADVTFLFSYHIDGFSTNIPSIICETFPNIRHFDLYNLGVTEITDSALAGCSRIFELNLAGNRISSISANAFVNLRDVDYINLEGTLFRTLPENVFANQQNLTVLNLNFNSMDDIPVNLFQPLVNLEFLFLGYSNLAEVNNQWFANNQRLFYLNLGDNRITQIPENFIDSLSLENLNLGYNAISEISPGAFGRLPNLVNLYLYGNRFTELGPDSFPNLGRLEYLDISENPINVIHNGAFRGLVSLSSLGMSACGLRQLNSNIFEGLENLDFLYANFNQLEGVPAGLFAPLENTQHIGMWGNRLKTLHRSSFGTLTSLQVLDLDQNVLNALDRAIIDEAVNLNTMYFFGNLCASNYFGNFILSRAQYLPILDRCFTNMRYIVETTTEGDGEHSFFDGPSPGIALRVNSDNEVQIALTPFSFLWNPSVEILIGTANNTRSTIRINQETEVVTVPTPNIIRPDQWNDFRVTWINQVVLVFSGNNTFPFMGYTMQDFFPVNFYGLRAVETRALWTVQPFDW